MKETTVWYEDENGNILFTEKLSYCDIPPEGRQVTWSAIKWKVTQIIEDWDNGLVKVQFTKQD